jgi:fructose-1,6-bisphosphatase/inositol monophosphatase family enzyme
VVLVREAGGYVTNFEGLNVPIASNSIIAANKNIHGRVFTVVEKHMGHA